jgi:hypothetical protein
MPGPVFAPISVPLFGLSWPAGAPPGAYEAILIFTPAGAFSDDRANPTEGIVLAPAGFLAQ